MHDIILWRVRVTTLTLTTQQYFLFPSSLVHMWLSISYSCTALPKEGNKVFLCCCCWGSKHFLLQLTTITVKHPKCVCILPFGIRQANRIFWPYCIVVFVKSASTIFLHCFIDNMILKKILNIIWDLIFCTMFFLNISRSKENSDTFYHKYIRSVHARYPIFLSCFNPSWISSTDFRKILRNQMSRSCCMLTVRQTEGRTYRQTDMKRLKFPIGNFATSL